MNKYDPRRMQFFNNGEGGGGDAPLNTSIGIDFSQAQQDIENFNKYIDSISNKFKSLSDNVKGLHLNVADLVAEELENIKTTGTEVNIKIADKLKDKIEKAIAQAVSRDIEIYDTSGSKMKFTAQFTEAQINAINRKIASGFVNNLQFNPSNMTVNISVASMQALKKKFQDFLTESFNKKKIRFTTVSDTDDGKVEPIRFEVTAQHWKALVNSVQEKFAEFIGKTDNIKITTFGELNLSDSVKKFVNDLLQFTLDMRKEFKDATKVLEGMKAPTLKVKLPTQALEQKLERAIAKFIEGAVKNSHFSVSEEDLWNALKSRKLVDDKIQEAFKKESMSVYDVLSYAENAYNKWAKILKAYDDPKFIKPDVDDPAFSDTDREQNLKLVKDWVKKTKVRYKKIKEAFEKTEEGVFDIEELRKGLNLIKESIQTAINNLLTATIEEVKKLNIDADTSDITNQFNEVKDRLMAKVDELLPNLAQSFSSLVDSVEKFYNNIVAQTAEIDFNMNQNKARYDISNELKRLEEKIIEYVYSFINNAYNSIKPRSSNDLIWQELINRKLASDIEREISGDSFDRLISNAKQDIADYKKQLKKFEDPSYMGEDLRDSIKELYEDREGRKAYIENRLKEAKKVLDDINEVFAQAATGALDTKALENHFANFRNSLYDYVLKLFDEIRRTIYKMSTSYDSAEVSKKFRDIVDTLKSQLDSLMNGMESTMSDFVMSLKDFSTKVNNEFSVSTEALENFQFTLDLAAPIKELETKLQNTISNILRNITDSLQINPDESEIWAALKSSNFADDYLREFYEKQGKSVYELLERAKSRYEETLEALSRFDDPSYIGRDLGLKGTREENLKKVQQWLEAEKKVYEQISSAFMSADIGVVDTTELKNKLSTLKHEVQSMIDNMFGTAVDDIKNLPIGTIDIATVINNINTLKEDITNKVFSLVPNVDETWILGGDYIDKLQQFKNTLIKETERMLNRLDGIGVNTKDATDALRKWAKELGLFMDNKVKQAVANTLETLGNINIPVPKDTVVNQLKTHLSKSLDQFMNRFFDGYLKQINGIMLSSNISDISIKTKNINSEIRKRLAQKLDVSVAELVDSMPTLEGSAGLNTIFKEMFEIMAEKFGDHIGDQLKSMFDQYKEAMNRISIEPDLSVVDQLARMMGNLQQEIVRKIRSMIDNQFKAVLREIREMKIVPASINGLNIGGQMDKVQRQAGRSISNHVRNTRVAGTGLAPITNAGIGPTTYMTGPKGEIRNFATAVVNTMNYILSGMILGIPIAMANQSWESAKEFEFALQKARQNILAKYRGLEGEPFEDIAEANVRARYLRTVELARKEYLTDDEKDFIRRYGVSEQDYNNPERRKQIEANTRMYLEGFLRTGVVPLLQNLGIDYAISQVDVARIWEVASRSIDDPRGAYYLSRAAARMYAMERGDISPEEAATGLESIKSQWGINYTEFERYSNMLMKAAMLNQSTVKDLIETQQRSGAIFRSLMDEEAIARGLDVNYDSLSANEKSELRKQAREIAFARSVALSSLFVQATARPGNEGGTFWRNVFAAPFERSNVKYLQGLASSIFTGKNGETLDLSYLNPFNVTYDEKSRRTTEMARDGYEMFTNIIRAFMELKASGNEQHAYEMISKLYGSRNMGGEQAIAAIIEDLDRQYEKLVGEGGEVIGRGLEDLVQQIVDTTNEEIDQYLYGMSQTFEFKQDRLKSTFEAVSFEIIEALKPEFSTLLDSLTGLLRMLRDNADTVTNVVGSITKILLAFGVKTLGVKGINKLGTSFLSYEHEDKVRPLVKERIELLKRRSNLLEKSKLYEDQISRLLSIDDYEKLMNYTSGHERLTNKLNRLNQEREILLTQRVEYNRILDQINIQETSPEEIEDIRRALKQNKQAMKANRLQRRSTEREIQGLNVRIRQIEGVDSGIKSATEKLLQFKNELAHIDQLLIKNNTRTERLTKAYRQLGMSEKDATDNLSKLEKEIRKILSNGDIITNLDDIEKAFERLDRMFDNGAISANEYVSELNRLTKVSAQLGKDLPGGEGSSGDNSKPNKIQNLLSMGGVLSSSTLKGAGNALKAGLKQAGILAVITFLLDSIAGPFARLPMTKGEAMSSRLNDLEKSINILDNYTKSKGLGILINAVGSTFDGLTTILSSLLEGDMERLTDYGKAWWYITSGMSKDEVYNKLNWAEKERRISEQIGEEQRQEEARRLEGYIDIDGDGIKEYNPAVAKGPIELVQEMITRLQNNLQLEQSKLQTEYNIKSTEYKIQGLRENSEELQKLMENFLKANIDALQDAIDQIEYAQQDIIKQRFNGNAALAANDAAWKALEQERQGLLDKQTQYKAQQVDAQMMAVQRITEENDLKAQAIRAENAKIVSDILASGVRNNSIDVLRANSKQMEELRRLREKEVEEYRKQLETNPYLKSNIVDGKETNSRREDLENLIKEKEAEIADYNAQIEANRFAEAFVYVEDLQRESRLLDNRYRSLSAQLSRKGYGEDSTAQKLLERQRLLEENKRIENTLLKLNEQLKNARNDQVTDLLMQISELEAKANENLTKIYKLFANETTFGVPQGLRIMTNYEYYTRRNTQRAFAVQQGGVTVTFRIDTVYTTSKEDLQKTFIEPITELMKQANKESVTQLNDSIRRGVQNHV